MLTTIASYRFLTNDLSRSLERTAHRPDVERESAYYLKNIEQVKTVDEFLKDDRLFNYAMKAYGLEEMSYAKAFMRKALEEGIDNPQSFANSLTDTRYQEFVTTFNFERYKDTATLFERTRQGTVDRFVRQTLEEDAGEENEGVRLALYFERKAPDVSSAFGILADPALIKVVQTALGLPASSSSFNIDKQAEIISRQLNIEDLKDPEKLDQFIERFTALWEIEQPSQSGSSIIPNILLSSPRIVGLGTDLLTNLQKLKLGG